MISSPVAKTGWTAAAVFGALSLATTPTLAMATSTSSQSAQASASAVPGSRYPKVDVHAHFLPDFYIDALVETGNEKPDGMPAIPAWSIDAHLSLMETANIAHTILSISSPGVSLYLGSPSASAALAAQCNDAAANASAAYPDKFSFWAALPLPFVAEALAEIERVKDMPGRAGFGLMTSYMGDMYLGDGALDPVWERLDALNATVFIHPTTPIPGSYSPSSCSCSANNTIGVLSPSEPQPARILARYPAPMLEFFFDTARTISDLLLQRVPQRFPGVNFIVAHAGGAFPTLLSRIVLFGRLGIIETPAPAATEAEMGEILATRFFYDLAGEPLPSQIKGLMEGMGIGKGSLLYGSDFPFTGDAAVKALAGVLETAWVGGSEEIEEIMDNGAMFVGGEEN